LGVLEEPEEPDQIEQHLLKAVSAAWAAYETAPPTQKKSSRRAYMRALDKLNAYVTDPGARFSDPPNPVKVTRIGHRSKIVLLKQKTKHPAG
jgi:hypothetical protein